MSLYHTHPLPRWVEQNMPELDKQLSAASTLDECRKLLNEATGMNVHWNDPVHKSMDEFLEKLKEMKK